jgi:hypothetical protein
VSFAARGGELTAIPPQSLTLNFTAVDNPKYCGVAVQLVSFPANTTVSVDVNVSGFVYNAFMTTDALGNVFGYPIGTYGKYGGAVVTVPAGGLTTDTLPVSC